MMLIESNVVGDRKS